METRPSTSLRTIPAAAIAQIGSASRDSRPSPLPGDNTGVSFDNNEANMPSYDPLQMFKLVLTTGLRYVPDVGWLLSTLVTLLWPSDKPDIWREIRKQVEEMVNQKIDNAVFSLLKAKLDGLGDVLKLYLRALQTKDVTQIRLQFVASNTEFVAAAQEFQNPSYQWLIAPLSGMFATMHMTLLRDCVLHGQRWGWTSATYDDMVRQSAEHLTSYIQYLKKVTNNELTRYDRNAPASHGQHRTAIYDHYQPFYKNQILLVDDFLTLLEYLDPIGHPDKASDIPFKDVYSPAYGTADDWDNWCQSISKSGGVEAAYSRPLSSFCGISIEYFNFTPRVVDVAYPPGKGPEQRIGDGRVDKCGIISYPKGGVEKAVITLPPPKDGKRFNVTKVHMRSASIPLDVSLELDDGRIFNLWTRRDLPGGDKAEVAIPGRMLSTFNMWSRSRFYDEDLGCILFGFSVDTDFIPHSVRDLFCIGALNQHQMKLGAASFSTNVTPHLLQRRAAFWADISPDGLARD